MLYDSPEIYNAQDQLMAVNVDDVEVCMGECTFVSDIPCDQDFFNLCVELMQDNNLDPPSTVQEASDLYHVLRYLIVQLL